MSEKSETNSATDGKHGEAPDFEQALTELESLVTRLEKGELTLDESLKQFKRGVELTRRCQKILDDAQQVVEQLGNIEDESSAETLQQSD